MNFDLERFLEGDRSDFQRRRASWGRAQDGPLDHNILPQLRELGRSSTARHYGLTASKRPRPT